MEIEHRAYGPNSTKAEVQMLRDRVELLEAGILLFREVPVMSPFEIEITTDEIGKYLNSGKAQYIIIDLVGVAPPDSLLREKLKACYSPYTDQIEHMAFFTGMNSFLNLVAKFMVRTVGYKKYSFHKTLEQAIKAIKNE